MLSTQIKRCQHIPVPTLRYREIPFCCWSAQLASPAVAAANAVVAAEELDLQGNNGRKWQPVRVVQDIQIHSNRAVKKQLRF